MLALLDYRGITSMEFNIAFGAPSCLSSSSVRIECARSSSVDMMKSSGLANIAFVSSFITVRLGSVVDLLISIVTSLLAEPPMLG